MVTNSGGAPKQSSISTSTIALYDFFTENRRYTPGDHGSVRQTHETRAVPGDAHHASGFNCGNKITSRIDAEFVNSMTRRSMPMPSPAVGGKPYSIARM